MNRHVLNGVASAMVSLGICSVPSLSLTTYAYSGSYSKRSKYELKQKAQIVNHQIRNLQLEKRNSPQKSLSNSDRLLSVSPSLGRLEIVSGSPQSTSTSFAGSAKDGSSFASQKSNENNGNEAELVLFSNNRVKELIIVDETVPDKSSLYRDIKPGVDVVEINAVKNGVHQLTAVLSNYQNLEALHIVSHAEAGVVRLGNGYIDTNTLRENPSIMRALNAAMKSGADVMFYGCDLAKGAKGEAFIELISNAAEVDVAASSNKTGHSEQNGDWILEVRKGNIEATTPFSDVALLDYTHVLAINDNTGKVVTTSGFPGGYANFKTYDVDATGYVLRLDTSSVSNNAIYCGFGYCSVNFGGGLTDAESLTIDFTGGESFDIDSLQAYSPAGNFTYVFTPSTGTPVNGSGFDGGFTSQTLNFTNITSLTITRQDGSDLNGFDIDNLVIRNASAANSAPALGGTPADDTATEDVATAIDLSAYNISDADGDTITLTLAVDRGTIASTDGNGTTSGVTVANSGTTSMTLQGTAANLNTYLDDTSKITFTTDSNDTTSATLTVTPNDGTENGTADTVTINISAVNDDPTATGVATDVTVTEDTASNINLSSTTFADVDSNTITVTFTASAGTFSTPADGAGVGGGVTETLVSSTVITLVGAPADINTYLDTASNIQYTGASNVTGNDVATISVTANDGDGSGNVALGTVNVDITAVNDDPSVSGLASDITVTEDTASNVDLSAATFADTDSSTVTVTFTASAGTFSTPADGAGVGGGVTETLVSSTVITLVGAPADINTYLDTVSNIQYTGASNVSGNDAATITVTANDGDGSGNVALGTVNVDITAVNDDPTESSLPTDITVTEDIASNVDLSAATFADIDSSTITVTFTVGAGTFSTPADGSGVGGGVTETLVSSTVITLVGAPGDINTYLDTASYIQYTIATSGDDVTTLSVTANDGDGSGDVSLATINIDVTDTTAPSLSEITAVTTPNNDSTPSVTFSTDETGTLSIGGDCGTSSSTTISSTGNHTITLTDNDNSTPLGDGTYSNCTITVTDASSNASAALALTSFTIDTAAPVISEVTPVSTPGTDTTPNVTFTTNETGTMSLGGSCGSSSSTTISSTGNQTITLTAMDNTSALADGSYSDCTVTVTDSAGNASSALTLTSFTIDSTVPTISAVSIPNTSMVVGDTVTATITVAADTDDYTTGSGGISGSIGGYTLGSLSRTNATTYTATFTITDGGTDVASGSDVATSFTLTDSLGNTSAAYTTAISQASDPLFANVPDISLSADTNTIAEDGGVSTLTAALSGSLNNQWPSNISVNLAYSGTATGSGTDYSAASVITVSAGNSSGSTTVTSVDDALYDAASNETVIVDIDSVSVGAENGTQQETITITDAESAPTVTLSVGSASIAENGGSSSVTATLSNATYEAVTVNLAYSGTATTGVDYGTPSSSISISGGSTSANAVTGVVSSDDGSEESNETVIIDISSVSGGGASESGTQQQTITITDDDDTTSPVLSEVTAVITPANDSTPNVTFSTDETGTLSMGGSCGTSSSTTISSTGNQTITLTDTDNSSALADGTYSDCTVTITDASSNASVALALSSFTVDTAAPVISEVTAVTSPGTDTTPNVIFTTNETGTMALGGSCGSSTSTTISSTGNQTITLTDTDNTSALADGTYNDCTVTVTDASGNTSSTLTFSSFTVDTGAPTVAEVTAVSTPGNDTTPDVTFSTNETGTLSMGGSCGTSSSTTISSTGNQTITLTQSDNSSPLAEGAYADCSVTITDSAGNASSAVTLTSFTIDTMAPSLAEVTAVTTPGTDSTPSVTFSATEIGTLAMGGSCGTSSSSTISSTGNQSITLTQADNTSALADGTYSNCTATVTDASGNASGALTFTSFVVDTTAPSVGTNAGITVDEDADITFTTTELSSSDAVSAAADITYTLTAVPSNGSLTLSSGALSVSSTFTQADIVSNLLAYSHDGSETTSDSFSFTVADALGNSNNNGGGGFTVAITVTPTNDDPTAINLSANSVNQSDGANAVVGTLTTTDNDSGDSFTYTLVAGTGDTDNASFNINGDQLRVTDASALVGGNYSVRVQSSDGTATFAEVFSVTVTDDVAPMVSSVSVPSDGSYIIGESLNFTVNYDQAVTVDTTGGTPQIALTIGSEARVATYASGTGTTALVFSYIVVADDLDSDGVSLGSVIDLNGGSFTDSAANDADLNLTNVGALAGVLVDGVVPSISEVTAVATPANDTTPNVTINVTENGVLMLGGSCGTTTDAAVTAGDVVLTLSQTDNTTALAEGTYSDCSVTINDDAGNASATFTLSEFVIDTTAPALDTSEALTLDEGASGVIANTVLSVSDSVSNAAALTYTVSVLPANGTLQRDGTDLEVNGTFTQADIDNSLLTYVHIGDETTSDSFEFSVQDEAGNVLDDTGSDLAFVFDVTPQNDAPVIAEGESITVDMSEDGNPTAFALMLNASDVDAAGDTLTWSVATQAGAGAAVATGTGNSVTVTYIPTANAFGSDMFVVQVSDATTTDQIIVNVNVAAVNDAPTISGTPATTVPASGDYSFAPMAADVDPTDTLTFSATGLPSWASIDSGTGVLTAMPAETDLGSMSTITITVTDGIASASLAAFELSVVPGPDSDGDTISDAQEILDGTDPNDPLDYFDETAPEVTAPTAIVVDAVALYTPITITRLLGLPANTTTLNRNAALRALTSDNIEGDACCDARPVNVTSDGTLLLAPGRNLVTWRASDRMGNATTVQQVVNVRPLVSLSKDKVSAEGASTTARVILNGRSPFYPFTVPYRIETNSTADASDHDLVDGEVVFTEGQLESLITINLVDDGVGEGNEILIVALDDQTTNAQDLANGYDAENPDIYDINAGAKTQHVLTIVEGNVAPDVTMLIQQGGENTIQITQDGGNVSIMALVTDSNVGDTASFNWSSMGSALLDTDGDTSNDEFVIDPSTLAAGRYRAQVTVTDAAGASDTARMYFRVVEALPTLSVDDDSDGDGIDDASEGTADTDDDGIPDYLDNITATNVLPEIAGDNESFLVECDPGVRCRLGQFALLGENGGALLTDNDIEVQEDISADTEFDQVGGIFDFEIADLPTLGQNVKVVLPQVVAIPAGGVYRKFQNGSWATFIEDANNELHSAPGSLGFCPPPGDDAWQAGLVEGYYCVQLTIEDGGPNDADGIANGSVEDPGAVAVPIPEEVVVTSIRVTGSSGGGSVGIGMLALLGLMLAGTFRVERRKLTRFFLPLVFIGSSLISGKGYSFEFPTSVDSLKNGYVFFGKYMTNGSQEENDFVSGLNRDGFDVNVGRYNTSNMASSFGVGYPLHDSAFVELGYVYMNDVSVTLAADVSDVASFERALERHYPVNGEGFTAVYRYDVFTDPVLDFSASVGLFAWDGEIEVVGDEGSDVDLSAQYNNGVDPLIGGAIHLKMFENFQIGFEMTRYFMDDQKVDLLGLKVVFNKK